MFAEPTGIASAGLAVWLLGAWRNRPRRLGLWLWWACLALVAMRWFMGGRLGERAAGWIVLVGAVLFGVGSALLATVDRAPVGGSRREPGTAFSRTDAIRAMVATGLFGALAAFWRRWDVEVAMWGATLGVGVALWQHRPPPEKREARRIVRGGR